MKRQKSEKVKPRSFITLPESRKLVSYAESQMRMSLTEFVNGLIMSYGREYLESEKQKRLSALDAPVP